MDTNNWLRNEVEQRPIGLRCMIPGSDADIRVPEREHVPGKSDSEIGWTGWVIVP